MELKYIAPKSAAIYCYTDVCAMRDVGVRPASIHSSNVIVSLRPYVVVISVVISRPTRAIKAACANALPLSFEFFRLIQ